jgi:hypothetical protein
MSTLRVIGVSVSHDPERKLSKAHDWLKLKIQEILDLLEFSYQSIPEESSNNLLLIKELRNVAVRLLNAKYLPHTTIESIGKDYEIFSRKAEKLQVIFRQKKVEIKESELLENHLLKGIRDISLNCLSEGLLSRDDDEFQKIKTIIRDIKNLSTVTMRIGGYKPLFKDIHILAYDLRERNYLLIKKCEDIKKALVVLNKKELTVNQFSLVKRLYNVLTKIDSLKTLKEKERVVKNVEIAFNKLSHIISGKEYINLEGMKKVEEKPSNLMEKVIPADVYKVLVEDEYLFFRERILSMKGKDADEQEYELLTGDEPVERLTLMRDNLKLEYGLLKEQIPVWNYVKEVVNDIILNISSDPEAGSLLDDAIELYDNPYPEPKELAFIRRRYAIYTLKRIVSEISEPEWCMVLGNLLGEFEKKGYIIPDISCPDSMQRFFSKSPLTIETPSKDYLLLLSLNPLNELVFRLAGYKDPIVTDGEDSISVSEDDIYVSGKWDTDYADISKIVNKHGITLSEKVAKSPEEVPVFLIDKTCIPTG